MKVIFAGLLLLAAGLAQASDNPYSGTWKIDGAKSDWSDGKLPKGMSLAITMSFHGEEMTYHSVNDTDKAHPPALVDYTAKLDWKPVPLAGASRYNKAAVRMVSPTQMEVMEMRDGNVIVYAIYDLMPGGKRFARRGMAISADGSSHEYEEFFDKQ